MNPILRGTLVLCAFLMLVFVIRKLRKAQFDTSDSVFWLLMVGCLLLVAIFPQVAYFFSDLLGIQSPSNFIFLAVIGLLTIREFTMQAQLVQLRRKISVLVQETALHDYSDSRDPETDH